MAGITQQVPSYVHGISEQPDFMKLPGQVVDLKNGIPDVTRGLIKRPGGKLISAITPSAGTLSWFHMYHDEDDQYIGNVNTSGVIQIWRTSDGAVIPLDYSAVPGTNACTYLSGWTNADELQALTVNESTFIANRNTTVTMKTDAADKSPAVVHEAVIELKTISYGKQYALDIYEPSDTTTQTFTRATAIAADDAITTPASGYTDDGKCMLMGREVVNQGTVTGKTNLRYEMDLRCSPVAESGGSSNPAYDDSYQPYAKLQFGGEGWAENDTHSHVSEKGATTTVKIKKHITITCRAGLARVRPAATSSSADESVTAEGILGDMKSALDAISGHGITSTIVGTSLHLKRSTEFNVTTPEPQLMQVTTGEANNIGDLPTSCRHGYVVKVVNSGEEDDDFYLKFRVDNVTGTPASDRFGVGVWEECPAPNLEIALNDDTLPIKLVRENPGNTYPYGRFLVEKPTWIERDVGDNVTNPEPSFVGSKINKLLFFRNRLVILSDQNVILSRTNDFHNFWSKTAMAVSNDDPVDLQSSSTFPTVLYDGIEVNSGLLLFSSNQQFMLTTDSDSFTPQTAKVNYLSAYNFNHKTKPFSLGVTSGFINSTGKNARFFEMADVRREGEPTVLEQSKIVSKLLPIDLTMVTSSKENTVVLFGSENKNEIWGYRFFNTGERRVQSSWFRWLIPGNLIYHAMMDDVYYTVVKNGTDYTLEAYDVRKQDGTTIIGTSPDDYKVHLDCHKLISSGSLSYSATTNKTTFTKPTGFNSSNQLAVYVNVTGDNIGRYSTASVNGSNVEIDGDWTGTNLILGYLYEWEVEIPTIYPTQAAGEKTRADIRSSLTIHRMHFSFGSVGLIETTLKRKGKTDYTTTYESLLWDNVDSSSIGVASEYIHTIPAYERNTNLSVHVKSKHPSPATLHAMNWEGDYSGKFYRRV